MKLPLALAALGLVAAAGGFWNGKSPDDNAEKVVGLFKSVCVDHLGRSAAMAAAVERSGSGFTPVYQGNATYGPVWQSAAGRITAYDHRHNHDGDECQIDLRRPLAPSAEATIAALRRRGLVQGSGQPSELGATAFGHGDAMIFVRYSAPDERSGVTEESAGLMLLIKRPAG